MKNKELIEILKTKDPDLEVLRPGHPDGGGFDPIDDVSDVFYNPKGYPCSYAGYYDQRDSTGTPGLLFH